MENIEWTNWAVRIGFFLLLAGTLIVFFRWLKRLRERLGELRRALSGSLRRQMVGIALAALACALAGTVTPLVELSSDTAQTVDSLLASVWVALAAWALSVALSVMARMVHRKYDITEDDNLHARRVHTRIAILLRILVVLIWIGAIAGILMQYDKFRTLGTTLLASAGVLSVVLGISAQKTFGSIIAGIQIALSQPIKLDDVVIVEGEWGRIEEITFTYVVVRIWDRRRLILPVTYFLEHPFQNWTRKNADLTGTVSLRLDYETPLEPLREEARRLCESAGDLWDGEVFSLQVTDADEQGMVVRVLAGSPDASKAWDLRCLIREGLIVYLRDNHPQSLPRRRLIMADDGE